MRDGFVRLNLSGKLTLYGVALATLHLLLAIFDIGKSLELWPSALPFYLGLTGITTVGGVALHMQKRKLQYDAPPPYEPELNPERDLP